LISGDGAAEAGDPTDGMGRSLPLGCMPGVAAWLALYEGGPPMGVAGPVTLQTRERRR